MVTNTKAEGFGLRDFGAETPTARGMEEAMQMVAVALTGVPGMKDGEHLPVPEEPWHARRPLEGSVARLPRFREPSEPRRTIHPLPQRSEATVPKYVLN